MNSAVSASEALTGWVALCTVPGCTRPTVSCRTAGNGAVRANASGPDPAAAMTAVAPSAPTAIRRPAVAGAAGLVGGGVGACCGWACLGWAGCPGRAGCRERAGEDGRPERAERQHEPGVGQQER